MAEIKEKPNTSKKGGKKKASSIDPVYQKFTKTVMRTLASSDFYEYFMDSIAVSKRQMQFSNRKVEKIVDLKWVDAIENTLEAFQTIVENPRNIIREEEIIVNVAHAKKGGPDVVKHLAQHSSFVEDFNYDTGEVRPSKLMQKIRDDSTTLYENRLVYTTMESAYRFVSIRYDALMSNMSDEMGAKLKVSTDVENATELVHFDMYMHIRDNDNALQTDEKNRETFDRIARIQRLLAYFMNTPFIRELSKEPRVRGNLNKTNILKKNPNYRKVVELYEFLRSYDQVGYVINIKEQNPEIDEVFERDIYHNIMFNYIILKGYLEEAHDRELPVKGKQRKRNLKPKFIKEIIEELVEDYDMTDVEVRKVLIEELTKEQLMFEQEQERLRLVEEAEQSRKRVEDQLRIEREQKKAEAERLRKEEAERKRKEREEAEERKRLRALQLEREDRARTKPVEEEIRRFMAAQLEKSLMRKSIQDELAKRSPVEDFEDFVWKMQEAERLEAEEQARLVAARREERRLREEEKRRIAREEKLAREKRLREQEELLIAPLREELHIFAASLIANKARRNGSIEITEN